MLNASDRVIVDGEPVEVGAEIACSFRTGDRLFGVSSSRVLHVPQEVDRRVISAVERAQRAFADLQACNERQITHFFDLFAEALRNDEVVEALREANRNDLDRARGKGRSTTRLEMTDTMVDDMVGALALWRDASDRPSEVVHQIIHEGWTVESVRSPLGVVAFVFEGRPNVFSDATGVLRMGNTCVFRIGSDALETARAIMRHAVEPSLVESGLPSDAVVLIDDPSHAAAWSLFAQHKIALAVARGSGEAVRDLGAVARQSGIPVSLHGTGGAWMIVCSDADESWVNRIVRHSLDRKVCNTVNVVCIVGTEIQSLTRSVLSGIEEAALARGARAIVHDLTGRCIRGVESTTIIAGTTDDLSIEWEWEENPEISLVAVDNIADAVSLFNEHSPQFVLSLLTSNSSDAEFVWNSTRSPFFGNGMTRWVDGQYALNRPELGLANWEHGALLGRGAILSGGDVYTVRYRVHQSDPDLHR
jgi:glutamate-5-semialdehyde dehydrogenase